jgi:hypothetical protein
LLVFIGGIKIIKLKIQQRKKLQRQQPLDARNKFEINDGHKQDACASV